MRRLTGRDHAAATLLGAAVLWLLPGQAAAHSFGQVYNLPIPLALYAQGAAAALLLSFLIAAALLRHTPSSADGGRSFSVEQPWMRGLLLAAQCLSVALLLLAMVAGRYGHPNSNTNISMNLFWIVFVLGFAYSCALVGGLYERANPWRLLAETLVRPLPRLRDGLFRYPHQRLGYWPAVILYMGFIWLELFGQSKPATLAVWLFSYSLLNLGGSLLFGARSWFRYAEFFSVFLRLISLFAPLALERRDDGRWHWNLRWPGAGLLRKPPEHLSLTVFVLCMLATTAFDGFHESVPWLKFYWSTLVPALDPGLGLRALYKYQPWFPYFQAAGLLLAPLLYLAAYWLAIAAGRKLAASALSQGQLLREFSYSLIPIALVYHAAHYYTLLQTEGLRILPLLSDPLGRRWDLFGTADWFRYAVIPDAAFTWHAQVGLIVLGHVLSVFIAHRQALKLFDNRRQAALSQLPMLLLMMAYTTAGLWILALPIQTPRML